jgi:MFS family permease
MVNLTIWNSFGFFFLDFLIPFVASIEINASGTAMGVIFSIRTAGYLIIAPIAGNLADRFSNKILIFIGSCGRGISYFILYFSIVAKSLPLLIVGNFFLGFMAGFYWIPLDVLISEKSKKEHRSYAFGIRNAKMGQGTFIGATIGFGLMGFTDGAYPGNTYLLYSALLIFGCANIYGGIQFLLKVDENLTFRADDENQNNQAISYRSYLGSLPKNMLIGLLLIFTVLFLGTVNGTLARPFILVYLTQHIESDPTLASMAYIPAGVISMLVAPKLGQIADRLDVKKVISISSMLGALTTWLLINTNSLILFSFLLVVDITVATTVGLVVQSMMSRISTTHRGKIFGLQTFFIDIGAIAGPIIGGIFWDRLGYRSPFIFSIFVEFLLIPIYILAIKTITPHLSEQISKEYS